MSTASAHRGSSVVVVGGGLAGLRTAEWLRRLGFAGGITVLADEPGLPYDRPPMSKGLLLQDHQPTPVPLRRDGLADLAVDWRSGTRAVGLDDGARRVLVEDGGSVPYDRLVIATGVRARVVPSWAGVQALRTFADCSALHSALRRHARVTVVGAGVLGCEVAASARTLGLDVDLVDPLEAPLLRAVGPEVGAAVAELHRRRGVRLHLSSGVSSVSPGGVGLDDGTVLEAGLVVSAVGSVVNAEWLEGSGVRVDDGVVCDATGESSVPGVFAVGDVARMPRGEGGSARRVEHWTNAADTAALVAANLLAERGQRRALREVPYFWTDQYDWKLQCLGTPESRDDVVTVSGVLGEQHALAVHSRDGHVTGVTGVNAAAALNRCRQAVADRQPLDDLLEAAPWRPPAPPRA